MSATATCHYCQRPIEDDDGTWYHVESMTARCDGPDDEPGLYWSDMVRQAEPEDGWVCEECGRTVHGPDGQSPEHAPSCSLHSDNEVMESTEPVR